jgi:hypothetical protein
MRLSILASSLLATSLYAAPYGFSDYYFVDPDRHWHVEGSYKWIAPAEFEKHEYHHINYSDADFGLYLTQSFDDENSLTYQLGYDYLGLGWNKNPLFDQRNFNYLVGSLGFVSTTLDKWRWIINTGFSVDAARMDFGPSGVYHAMLWGRYHFIDHLGIHVGALGWYGVENGRGYPVFGFDWRFNESGREMRFFLSTTQSPTHLMKTGPLRQPMQALVDLISILGVPTTEKKTALETPSFSSIRMG